MDRYYYSLRERLKNRNNRKVVLVGDGFFTRHIECVLIDCSIPVEIGQIPLDISKSSLDYFVLVCAIGGHKEYYEILTKMGYVYEIDFAMMNIGGYTRPITHIDPLLTYARRQPYDEVGEGAFKIMVLGDSVSDLNKGGMKVWPLYLQELCKRGAKIFLGAVAGYTSAQCLLKLIRDVDVLKPSLVICCSGATDIGTMSGRGSVLKGYPTINRYEYRMWSSILMHPEVIPDSLDMRNMKELAIGFKEELSDAAIWLRNMNYIVAICNSSGIPCMCILEPLLGCGGIIEEDFSRFLKEAGVSKDYLEEQRLFVESIREANAKDIYDFSTVLADIPEAYMDPIHYTSMGHKMLAQKIFEQMKLLVFREA